MKNQSIILFIIWSIIFLNCQESVIVKNESRAFASLDSIKIDTSKIVLETISQIGNPKRILELIASIESLYEIKERSSLDTIADFKIVLSGKHELGLRGLDLSKAQEYFSYYLFSFVVFKDLKSANKQFDRVVEVSDLRIQDHSNPERELYFKLFSKAGSSYILYDKMIIYHRRQCNYNEKIEVPREERFLAFLFNNKPPTSTYFVRVRCGWIMHEKK